MRDTLEPGMPAAIEAERSILGAVLLDNRLAHEAVALVRADHFSLVAHRRIYAAISALVDGGEPTDTITLAEKLGRRHDLDAIGGLAYLSSLIDGVPDRPSIAHYCKIVRERALLRGLTTSRRMPPSKPRRAAQIPSRCCRAWNRPCWRSAATLGPVSKRPWPSNFLRRLTPSSASATRMANCWA
jgi:hypothetical protein